MEPAAAPPQERPGQLLGLVAVVAASLAAVAILTLDVVVGGDLLRGRALRGHTISEYVFTSGAWAYEGAIVVLALGSVALLIGLCRRGIIPTISIGSALLALWIAGLTGIVAFPKHNWAIGPSTEGSIHRIASIVAFLALPLAVLVITRRRRRNGSAAALAARWFAAGAIACLLVLLGAVVAGSVTGRGWWQLVPLGLVERGIAGFEVAAIIALGWWLGRPAPPDAGSTNQPSGVVDARMRSRQDSAHDRA